MTAPTPIPSAKQVDEFHRNADTNKRPESLHHTLGQGPNSAAPGNHNHDGQNSQLLITGSAATITGSRSTALAAIVNDLLNALSALGIQNGTTP